MQSMNTGDQAMADRRGGSARRFAIVAAMGSLGFAGFALALLITPGNGVLGKLAASPAPAPAPGAPAATAAQVAWVAAAPGRVEPRSGQIRIGTMTAGRVVAVAVSQNDKVAESEVLIRLEDKEARARLTAAESEAAARKKERDAQTATSGRENLAKAEDALFTAERTLTNARFELDDLIAADRKGNGSALNLSQARRRLADAKERLRQEQVAYASTAGKSGVPAPSRLDAAVIAARAEVTMAETMLERTRIRAPMASTVLQMNAKLGELVAPSPELPLVVIGDMTVLRVRAEVDEHDVAKIKVGQRVFVRNTAYPGQEFDGKVTEIAPSLAMPKMGSRGIRRATDVEVMEVVIELEASSPLLPGMRTDAFFRR